MRGVLAFVILGVAALAAFAYVQTYRPADMVLLSAATPAAVSSKPSVGPAQAVASTPAPAPVVAQAPATSPAPAAAPRQAAPQPMAPRPIEKCDNPNAIGLSRVVEIDTTGGPGFGFEHFKQHNFLRNKEVVLTFDDGPWPTNTRMVLDALKAHCIKATFFPVGKHATWYPEILKEVAAEGHSIGNHTWSHKNLEKMKFEDAKAEIEMGASAVAISAGVPVAPYFRFPALRHPPELVTYLGERNMGIFSTDMDSFDFTMRTPERVIASVLKKLEKHGKGIVLMHDFQRHTAEALPELLRQLKDNGYKIVHMQPKNALQTVAEYDEMVKQTAKLPTVSDRPTSAVVRTINE